LTELKEAQRVQRQNKLFQF